MIFDRICARVMGSYPPAAASSPSAPFAAKADDDEIPLDFFDFPPEAPEPLIDDDDDDADRISGSADADADVALRFLFGAIAFDDIL